jgi:hypothetical protein
MLESNFRDNPVQPFHFADVKSIVSCPRAYWVITDDSTLESSSLDFQILHLSPHSSALGVIK